MNMDKTIPFYIKVLSTSASNPHIYFYRGYIRTVLFESFEYSFDNVNWNTLIITDDSAITILSPVAVGDIIYFRVKPTEGVWYKAQNDYCQITPVGCTFEVGGNIMSLFYGGGFTGDETSFITGTGNCRWFFAYMDVVDASQLLLPATTLTSNCYYRMFNGCTSLTTAPELPATTLANYCYQYMFQDCISLTTAPPIIQATIPRSTWPYEYMFSGCSSLENITIENTNIRNNEYILHNMSPKTIVYKKEGVTTPSNPNKLTVVTLKNTPFNVANAKKWVINNKEVKQVVDSQGRLIWKRPKPKPSYSTPFYLEDTSGNGNTVSITKNNSNAPTLTIQKSTDGVNWSTMGTTSTTAITAAVPANGKLYLRCNATSWGSGAQDQNNVISTTGYHNINVGGNIMSLLYGSNFTGQERTFPSGSTRTFENLFYNNRSIENLENLLLPATILTKWCYAYMFDGCDFVKTTPELPAMTLAENCYRGMFQDTGIRTAPVLPATTLTKWCYYGMFNNCFSLVTVILPAQGLAYGCYENMFMHCSNLKNIELPASTLATRCYENMFGYCRSLKNVECLATDISANSCLLGWMYNVPAGGTFTKKAGVTYPTGDSGIPNGWTVVEV